jgi:hypothetical protein
MKLLKSVGKGGKNQIQDVRLIQNLLLKNMWYLIPLRPLVPNGICDVHCVELIKEFQRRVLKMRRPDGLVETKGPTIKALIHVAKSQGNNTLVKRAGNVVPFFKQFDESWKARILGTRRTIKRAGCAISSIAMILAYYGRDMDPGKLDEYLDENDGYVGDNVKWAVAFNAGSGNNSPNITLAQPRFTKKNDFETKIDERITRNWPTLVHVDYGADRGLVGDHWVVIVGKSHDGHFIINDPGTSQGNGAANPNQDITKLGLTKRKGGLNPVRLCLFEVRG